MELGDYLKAINRTKRNIMRESDDPKVKSGYPAFLIRRLLSYHADAILFVNELNCLGQIDNQMQFEFFLHVLPKKDRYSKTVKSVKSENLDLVKRYYNYSDEKALAVIGLHNETDFDRMRDYFEEGGVR